LIGHKDNKVHEGPKCRGKPNTPALKKGRAQQLKEGGGKGTGGGKEGNRAGGARDACLFWGKKNVFLERGWENHRMGET